MNSFITPPVIIIFLSTLRPHIFFPRWILLSFTFCLTLNPYLPKLPKNVAWPTALTWGGSVYLYPPMTPGLWLLMPPSPSLRHLSAVTARKWYEMRSCMHAQIHQMCNVLYGMWNAHKSARMSDLSGFKKLSGNSFNTSQWADTWNKRNGETMEWRRKKMSERQMESEREREKRGKKVKQRKLKGMEACAF